MVFGSIFFFSHNDFQSPFLQGGLNWELLVEELNTFNLLSASSLNLKE